MYCRWVQDSPLGLLTVTIGESGVRSIVIRADAEPHADEGEPEPAVAKALEAYFEGDFAAVDGIAVDLGDRRPFSRAVLEALRSVPAGDLTSYGELAAMAGRPGAARAVGQTVGSNPVPVVVPCHRVVAADGSLGGFSAGLDVKRWLLAHEGHPPFKGGWPAGRSRR